MTEVENADRWLKSYEKQRERWRRKRDYCKNDMERTTVDAAMANCDERLTYWRAQKAKTR